jgi:hypothetical protein
LLAEVPPLPVAAGPARLLEVTHGERLAFEGFRDRLSELVDRGQLVLLSAN